MKFTHILILLFVGLLTIATSCSQKSAEQQRQDSILIADSIAREEALAEQARIDSIRQDSIRQDSIDKIEKFKAAIPTFNQIFENDEQKLFSKLGYKITIGRYQDIRDDEYYPYVSKAVYEVNDSMKVVYEASRSEYTEGGYTITITGLPEARDKFYSDAKASIAKYQREYPDDGWGQQWYAKISGDKITVYLTGD